MPKFQQTEQAIKSLTPILAELNKALVGVKDSLIKLDASAKTTAKTQDDLKTKTKANKTATEQLTKAQKAEAEVLRLATKQGKEEIAAQVKLTQAKKLAREEAQKNQGVIKKTGGLFRSMTKSILTAGAAYLSLRAAFTIVKNGLKTIIGFEKGMSAVKAITNATAKEFKALQGNALKLGATTAKTAIEVAGLQKAYAKLGFSTSEILAATDATINLSIAAESDLAGAATVAASTIRGFGFAATETGRITDVMAKSFTTTGLDLEKFKVSMSNAQVAAKATGKSFEFTTAALGTIVDTGTDASKAGTDLRNIFSQLAKQGLSLDDAYKLVNNSSNKVVTAMELVGKRAFSSLITIAEQSDKVNELTKAYENSAGAAKAMADIMADNLSGDIILATSAWDGFILGLNSGNGIISKSFRTVVQLATNLLNVITKLNDGEGLRMQRLKNEIDFENRLNQVKAKSLKIIEERSEVEGKSRVEITKGLVEELTARSQLADSYVKELEAKKALSRSVVKGATVDDINDAKIDAELKKESVILLQNVLAAELDAEKAKQAEVLETNRVKSQLAKDQTTNELDEIQKRLDAGLKANEKIRQEADRLANEEMALNDEDIKNLTAQIDAEFELKREAADREIELAKEVAEEEEALRVQKLENIATGLEFIASASQELFDLQQSLAQSEIDNLLMQRDAEVASAEKAGKDTAKIKEKYAKKEAALRNDQAKKEKQQALFSAGINIATGIVKALASAPPPANFVLAALVGVLGAIQLAAIAAKPIPKFFKGVSNFEGGIAHVGEQGTELISMPGHSPVLSPDTDTLMYLPKGTDITPNAQTEQIIRDNASDGNSEIVKELRLTRQAISKQSKAPVWTRKGLSYRDEETNTDINWIKNTMR